MTLATTTCKTCGAPVWYLETLTGRLMPVEPAPAEHGNIRIQDNTFRPGTLRAVVLAGADLTNARERGEALRVSHFATCAHADQHRRRP